MRYEELPWPFEGWTVDADGVIHTASGYRTTPQKIEAFCWLMGMHKATEIYGSARLMFNESSIEEKRPVFDWKTDTVLETRRPNDITASGNPRRNRRADRSRPLDEPSSRRRPRCER